MLQNTVAAARPLGQHWTFGPTIVRPIAPAPVVVPPKPFPIIALAGACILFTALAIAAAIVLSLIPLYASPPTLNVTCSSQPTTTTFNINNEILPAGSLSEQNLAALETAINADLARQSNFTGCQADVRQASIGPCSAGQRLLQRHIRRGRDSTLIRQARQINDNCQAQQLDSEISLNCGCRCLARCLREKVRDLSNYLASVVLEVNFPTLSNNTVVISGPEVPTNPLSTTQTSTTTASTTTATTTTTTTTTTVTTATTAISTSTVPITTSTTTMVPFTTQLLG